MIQCPNCKNQIPDCSQQCQFCGVQFTPPTQVGMQYQPHNQSTEAYFPNPLMFRVKNYQGLAITMAIIMPIALFICLWLLFGLIGGLIALVIFDTSIYAVLRSSEIDSLITEGRVQEAEEASQEVKKWSIYPVKLCFLAAIIIGINEGLMSCLNT